jgi:hypothetical protein
LRPADRIFRGARRATTIVGMNPVLSMRILVALSILYGILIAILAMVNASTLTLVAVIGALVLGGLWVVRGLFANRSSS